MHIRDIFAQATGPLISFEFFPPNTTEGHDRLKDAIAQLAVCRPAFVSITYGAGGSTRDATKQVVGHVKTNTALNPVPHFTCVNHQREDIDAILHHYAALGISNILALRGDAPKGRPDHDHGADFCVQCADLVRHIQAFNQSGAHRDRRGFGIGAACFPEGHPATPNRMLEMDHLKAKVDAGIDFLITQAFFDNHVFHDFRDRCELADIRVPILAGILPLPNIATLNRVAQLAGNMRYPAKLLRALHRAGDDPAAFQTIAEHHAAEQCHDLLDHEADGIHFYTLNRVEMTLGVMAKLGWSSTQNRTPWRSAPRCVVFE